MLVPSKYVVVIFQSVVLGRRPSFFPTFLQIKMANDEIKTKKGRGFTQTREREAFKDAFDRVESSGKAQKCKFSPNAL